MIDLIIDGATVLTMENGVGYYNDASIGINNGKITFIAEQNDSITDKYKAKEYISGKDKLIMPGFIDAHMHTEISIFRGLAQDLNNWMELGLWPFSQHLDQEASEAAIRLNILEAIKNGTTTIGDFGSEIDITASTCQEFGVRGVLAKTINELDKKNPAEPGQLYNFDHKKGEKELDSALKIIDKYKNDDLLDFNLGPQALDMVSMDLLKEIYKQARNLDIQIHMHVAQGDREDWQIEKRYGDRTIPILNKNNLLGPELRAVHLTEATPEETKLLAESGAALTICSGSIGIIDGLVPPLQEFLEVSDRISLGSDQAPGNNCNNMFNEIKLTSLFNKIKSSDPRVLNAGQVLQFATSKAAEALNISDKVGSIAPGKEADLIFIDLKSPALTPVINSPLRNLVPNLVYSASGQEVESVMISGEFVVKDHKFLPANEEQIINKANQEAKRLMAKVDRDWLKEKSPLYKLQEKGYL